MDNIVRDFINIDLSSFDDSKRTYYIFGKNGSGKTTISREITKSSIKSLVFNKDYVLSNIFIEQIDKKDNQVKSSSNESVTFDVFFGEEQVTNYKRKILLNDKIKENQKLIVNELKTFDKSLLEIFGNMGIETNTPTTFLKLDKEEAELNKSRKLSKLKLEKIKKLNNDKLFIDDKNILINKRNDFVSSIKEINNLILAFNSTFKTKGTDDTIYKIHEIASKYKEKKEIDWLGEKYPVEDVIKYLKKLSNKKEKSKQDLLKKIKDTQTLFKTFTGDSLYKKVFNNKEVNNDKSVNAKLTNLIKEINSKKKINEITEIEKTEKLKETNIISEFKTLVGKTHFFILENHDNVKKIYQEIKKDEKEVDEITKKLEQKQKNLDQKANDLFNKHLDILSAGNLSVEFLTNNRNKTQSTKLKLKNGKNIEKISEGEKNSFALSYFLSNIEMKLQKIKENFIVFIDDPFDSNDHQKSDSFKDIEMTFGDIVGNIPRVFHELAKSKGLNSKFIFSTHDIATLSSISVKLIDKNKTKRNLHFAPIHKDHDKNFDVYNLISKQSNSSLEKVNLSHFFPYEHNLASTFEEVFEKIIKKEGITRNNIGLIKTISVFLVKYYDNFDTNKREFFKIFCRDKIFLNINPNSKTQAKDIKRMKNSTIPKKEWEKEYQKLLKHNGTKIKVEPYLTKHFNNLEDSKLIISYLIQLSSHINNINEENIDVKNRKHKRLRHKNNYHYSVIGYAIED